MVDLRILVQPFPIDASWAEFNKYVSNKDWARIAGTCKASWYLQLQQLYLAPTTPVAGELQKRYLKLLLNAATCEFASAHVAVCHVLATGMASAELLRAGYPFVLRRCQDASFISVTKVAEPARKALREKLGLNSDLKHLRKLIIIDSPNGKEYIAPYIRSRCPNLQVRPKSNKSINLLSAC